MRPLRTALALTAALAAGVAHAQTSNIFSSIQIFKRVVSGTAPRTVSSPAFTTLTTVDMYIPAGVNALVTARFSAESKCTETGTVASNICVARILIGGIEADPVEAIPGGDFAFDSTNSGSAMFGDFESHSMDRHRCVRNASSQQIEIFPVTVQIAVTNTDGGLAPTFHIDDWSLTIEANLGCYTVP